jgi:hypothetical protein
MRIPAKTAFFRIRLILVIFALTFIQTMGVQVSAASIPAAATTYSILVDNRAVAFDVSPLMKSSRLLVPFRAIAESLGIAVTWDQDTMTAHAAGYGKTVSLQIGNLTARIDGTSVPLDVAPLILNSRTLIPLRFFSEAFGCIVTWDGPARTALVLSPVRAMEIYAWYAMDGNWRALFAADYPNTSVGGTDAIGTVVYGWYEMMETGKLVTNGTKGWQKPAGWENALSSARKYMLNADLCAYMTDGGGALTRLMENPGAWRVAADELAAESAGYDGVNLDMEGLGLTDTGAALAVVRSQYTGFVRVVAEKLHTAGKTLTLTLHPINSEFKGYDYAALAPLADRILMMAYDFGQKPEPYQLVHEAIDSALLAVPKEKLVLGISFASETAESLISKLGLAKQHGLAGVALWRLGLMAETDWTALRSSVLPK